jgi:phage terminase small subunit
MAACKTKPDAQAPGVITPSVDVFIAQYLKDNNGRRAAIAVGYSAKTVAAQASRLLTQVNVKQAIEQARTEVIAQVKLDTGITLERTLTELARIAFFDPRRLFDAKGHPLAITDLDDDTAAVVAGLDVLEEYDGTGRDRVLTGYVKKRKLSDKKGALDLLMKHLGGYKEDNEQKANPLTALLARIGKSTLPIVADPGGDDGGR